MQAIRDYLTPRRLRFWREYLTGYLLISPALLLIILFGFFPVLFALFVSVHKWRIIRSDYVGLGNYTRAVGNLGYVFVFLMGVAAVVASVFLLRRLARQFNEHQSPSAWLLAIPGLSYVASAAAFLRYGWFQLPEFLDIAEKLRGQERTRELFIGLLRDAFRAETVQPAWQLFVGLLLAAIVISIAAAIIIRVKDNPNIQGQFIVFWGQFLGGIALLYYSYIQVSQAYAVALEEGTDPGLWTQVITISAGVFLLIIAWLIWRSADKAATQLAFWGRIGAAAILLIGGWLLVGEIPVIIAAGDKDLWEGLKVTAFFSLGTVPFQLAFALFLAILLFQDLRGSAFFRMLFFVPYVTPFIASAAIFRQLFANRGTAPMNLIVRGIGWEPLAWLQESKGIVDLVAGNWGIESIPLWAEGPSLALVVVIIHSVWTYVGYNTVIYLAGLATIPGELNEAAEIDGANRWQVFKNITFPLLSPTTYFLSLIGIIGTFKAFATLWVFRESLALGTTDTLSVVIFLEFFEKLRYGYASAMAFVLFVIILSLTLINNRLQGSRVFYG